MEYVVAYGSKNKRGPTILLEEDGVTRASISADSRLAALTFMNNAKDWSKKELCEWLTGPYARATRHVAHGERTPSSITTTTVPAEQQVSTEAIDALLRNSRDTLIAALEAAVLCEGELAFAEDLADRDYVHRAVTLDGREDEEGLEEVVWVPIDATRMRLVDRVRSLFAADYLNDATDYRSLFVCPRSGCASVSFDPGARQMGMCFQHLRSSGIVVVKDDDLGLPVRRSI